MHAHEISIASLLQRIRGEYLEMPGLCLTLDQAVRLWNLDRTICRRVLHALTHEGFLVQSVADAYVRADFLERSRELTTGGRVKPGPRATASDGAQS